MREILFRGQTRRYGEKVRIGDGAKMPSRWVYGGVLQGVGSHSIIYGGENVNDPGDGLDKWCVHTDTLGQFTGLTDKNGKKIFEGDIGRYKQTDGATQNGKPITCIGKVIYNAKTASFAVESKDKTGCKYFDYFPIKDFEVIGNIHDNPELFEVE